MMQEVSDDAVASTQAEIVDQLQDAVQTNVTQGELGGGISTSIPSTPASASSPLTQSPQSITTVGGGVSPSSVSAMSQYTPANMGGSPPPPTGGFVPTPGAVTATPSKCFEYPAISSGIPGGQQMTTSAYSPSPLATFPTSMSQSLPPSVPPMPDFSTTAPAQQSAASYQPPVNPAQFSAPHVPAPPGMLQSPHEASASIDLGGETLGPVYPTSPDDKQQGLFGWFSGSNFMNRVVEKTKTISENVITTLDPGMKEVIYSGSDGVQVTVASDKEVKVDAVRQAFYEVFNRAVVAGMSSQPVGIAPQPVGYQAALKGCEGRIEALRQSGQVDNRQVLVAVENFIVEILPDRWYDIGCILLKDTFHNIELNTFTTATPVPSEYVHMAQDETPATYDLRWSGLAVTIGQVINRQLPYVSHSDWHTHFTGVSRKETIYLAVKMLATMYKKKLPVGEL